MDRCPVKGCKFKTFWHDTMKEHLEKVHNIKNEENKK